MPARKKLHDRGLDNERLRLTRDDPFQSSSV
jgi:hypothetical protein